MKLAYIFFLKSYREKGLMDVFLMVMIVLASNYKNTFVVYTLIPILFLDNFFNLIWSNANEKLFYSQFQKIELKKITSIKQSQFIAEFNACYLLVTILFFDNQNLSRISLTNWLLLNIFIFINLIVGNILFNIFFKMLLVKSFILLIINALVLIIIFSINTYLIDFSFIILFLIQVFLIFYRSYTLNTLFNNLHIKTFYD